LTDLLMEHAMIYMATTMNHLLTIKAWAAVRGMQAALDVESFELEMRAHNRCFKLFPQFCSGTATQPHDIPASVRDVDGFLGWLPYRPISWELANDKLAFKLRLLQAGLPTPQMWTAPEMATRDYLVKHSAGPAGAELAAPFKAGAMPEQTALKRLQQASERGSVYAEAFIPGRAMKVWFWGEHAFHAQLHSYPAVTGDGKQSVAALAVASVRQARLNGNKRGDKAAMLQALAYQGLRPESVLGAGSDAWLDHRYGSSFRSRPMRADEENALSGLTACQRAQIDRIGSSLAIDLQHEFGVPVLYSLDAVVDEEGRIWWLNMDSDPLFPPAGYPVMLADLAARLFPVFSEEAAATAQPAEFGQFAEAA
jgi:hypothetical protein